MTKAQEKRIVDIYGPDYKETDVPTIIRRREAEESEACQREADGLRQEQDN